MTEINGVRLPFVPAGCIKEINKQLPFVPKKDGKTEFSSIFQEEVDKLRFSAHAKARISSREIDLGENDLNRLNNAVERAKSKGARESLIMMDDNAFIVNMKSNTVITAVSKNQLETSVITNIDSAVIA